MSKRLTDYASASEFGKENRTVENYMLKEVESFPELIRETCLQLQESAETAANQIHSASVKNVLLFGSGDSYNAAVCAAQAFRSIAKLHTAAVPSMEAARYIGPDLTREQASSVLAVGISISGEALRGVEAADVMKASGCSVISLTANPSSSIAQKSEQIIAVRIPDSVPKASIPVPGLRSFLVSVMGLLYFAIAIGERRNSVSAEKADELRSEICGQSDCLSHFLDEEHPAAAAFAKQCAEERRMEFLGSGPGRGTADFGLSKVLEGQGYDVMSQDIEEYAHGSFFRNRPQHLPTIVICPAEARGLSRTMEILEVLTKQKRPLMILTDSRHPFSRYKEDAVLLSVEHPVREVLSPVSMATLMAWMAAQIPLLAGDIYMHGHQGAYNEENLPTIHGGEILNADEILRSVD